MSSYFKDTVIEIRPISQEIMEATTRNCKNLPPFVRRPAGFLVNALIFPPAALMIGGVALIGAIGDIDDAIEKKIGLITR